MFELIDWRAFFKAKTEDKAKLNCQPTKSGQLEHNFETQILILGSYVGEVIRKKCGGKWQFKAIEGDPDELMNMGFTNKQ
ncbi:MAG TPA: hypothetical protein VHY08_24945 [Bacillota bacterium]|nr:hypothetical protein [Bacillota bacterium]